MAQTGGEIAAKRPKPPGDGEDRLSALPDELLVLILLRLDGAAAAARTSILSRRWRRVWTLLPELRFNLVPDGHRIRDILDDHQVPEFRCISVTTKCAGPESAAAWLPVSAPRLIGSLVYRNILPGDDEEEEEEEGPRNEEEEEEEEEEGLGGDEEEKQEEGPGNDEEEEEEEERVAGVRREVQLPCFEKATMIVLDLGRLGLALPSEGVFAKITKLKLSRVWFHGPCDVGNVVSSPRCPCLQRLKVSKSRGLQNLSIHSESLLRIKLEMLNSVRQLTIVAPKLLKLEIHAISLDDDPSELVGSISVPQLVSLVWRDVYDSRYMHLGNLGQLQDLDTLFVVYGDQNYRDQNYNCLRLLQKFQILHTLILEQKYENINETFQDIDDFQYLIEDITMLPQVTLLYLTICNEGHAFGASSFHLLRMCTGLRKLEIMLYDDRNPKAQSICPSDCICDEPTNWKTEGLILNQLESAIFFNLQGSDHEVTFLKQLFNWAMVLKEMEITFDNHITESKAIEFQQALVGYSRPETSVKFYLSRIEDEESVYLLSPEGQGTGS